MRRDERGGAMPGVAVVSVPVTDQDRAVAFYTGYLGFRVVEDAAMGPTMRWVQLRAGDAPTTITLTTWFETMAAGTVEGLVLDVEDPDGVRAAMQAGGVACSELADEPWGRYFTCKDPDGNGLVVTRTTAAWG
jgi:catechol 2,3-dioxygenase-like lactoylglutathione lyase family enzyme